MNKSKSTNISRPCGILTIKRSHTKQSIFIPQCCRSPKHLVNIFTLLQRKNLYSCQAQACHGTETLFCFFIYGVFYMCHRTHRLLFGFLCPFYKPIILLRGGIERTSMDVATGNQTLACIACMYYISIRKINNSDVLMIKSTCFTSQRDGWNVFECALLFQYRHSAYKRILVC